MNKLLVIGLMAFVFSSCQSESAKQENVIVPTPYGVPSASGANVPSGQRPTKNPAHGLPFHDCAIPVGADLIAEQPVQVEPVKAPVQEVKLNPPHGEPGHKCEVAVGAPLS